MANYKKKQTTQRTKGCGLCSRYKRMGNVVSTTGGYDIHSRYVHTEALSRLLFRKALNTGNFEDV